MYFIILLHAWLKNFLFIFFIFYLNTLKQSILFYNTSKMFLYKYD